MLLIAMPAGSGTRWASGLGRWSALHLANAEARSAALPPPQNRGWNTPGGQLPSTSSARTLPGSFRFPTFDEPHWKVPSPPRTESQW